jgi:hypothetical protein
MEKSCIDGLNFVKMFAYFKKAIILLIYFKSLNTY